MKYIVGIDPGLNGAIAILSQDLEIIELVSMPTIPYGTTKRVYAPALRDLLAPYATAGTVAVLEDVHARPSDAGVPMGRGAAFTFGGSFHVALATLEMAGIGVRLIAPSTWKVKIGLQLPKGATRTQKKQASIGRATTLYPAYYEAFKKSDDKAEAVLVVRGALLDGIVV